MRICDSGSLREGGAGVRFLACIRGVEVSAFAVRSAGHAVAYVNRCTHLGVELDLVDGRFFDRDGRFLVCATHGAQYDASSGRCRDGPCKSHGGLLPLAIVERDGAVFWAGPGAA
jgi:nitrite reductase/ring-hydroxylating ferredoxin subunit